MHQYEQVMALRIKKNVDVSDLLTMRIGGPVTYFGVANSACEIQELCRWAQSVSAPVLVLGGGSNLVLSDSGFKGLAIRVNNKGIKESFVDGNIVQLKVEAGENWDDFVAYTVDKGYWGCENLSLIPGTVGATPIQNVGAFGQEVRNIIYFVSCYDFIEDRFVVLRNSECRFGFRSSIFKCSEGARYIVTSVVFRLSRAPAPRLSRGEFHEVRKEDVNSPSLQLNIRNIVISCRTNGRSLPNGNAVGSDGTFFRTFVTKSLIDLLNVAVKVAKDIGVKEAVEFLGFAFKYRSEEGFRVPSKMMIKWCGLSGKRVGSVELFDNNPAVVVSTFSMSPSSRDLRALIESVQQVVKEKTGAVLPIEPTLVGAEFDDVADRVR